MKKYFYTILVFTLPVFVFSAEFKFDSPVTVGISDEFKSALYMSSLEPINAVEGRIVFPTDMLDVKTINTGNSKINFWIESPKIDSPGTIYFSGITPGGMTGENNLLFMVVFIPKKIGGISVKLTEFRALIHDGEGTEDKISTKSLDFDIVLKPVSGLPEDSLDSELPESFSPEIGRDQFLFDGKWFVAFSTQDKNSGIKQYEVKESRQKLFSFLDEYIRADSPYVLKDQELKSHIFIRVVDNAENERIEKISPRYPLSWYQNGSSWITILIILFVLWAIKKWLEKS